MGHIRYEVRDRVATVTIDRPEKRNAMTFAILAEFEEAISRAGADDAVRAVVVTARALAECFGSEDHREGVAAFLERRPAQFTGH